jgi:hypothetical protein
VLCQPWFVCLILGIEFYVLLRFTASNYAFGSRDRERKVVGFTITCAISVYVISWRSVLLMEDIGVPGENHRPVASH